MGTGLCLRAHRGLAGEQALLPAHYNDGAQTWSQPLSFQEPPAAGITEPTLVMSRAELADGGVGPTGSAQPFAVPAGDAGADSKWCQLKSRGRGT